MTETKLMSEESFTPEYFDSDRTGPVSVARLSKRWLAPNGKKSRRVAAAASYAEEYEIGIGRWKATIVKQVDCGDGQTMFTTRIKAEKRGFWKQRRRQRSSTTRGARRNQPT